MTYPGMVLLVGIGVGIATFLYYMFTESNHSEQEHNQQYTHSRNRRPSNYSDDWTSHSSSENGSFRRNSSNSVRSKEGRNSTNKEDTSNCTICQFILIGLDVMELPCGHNFHARCVENLRSHNPKAPCPNCRKPIKRI